MKIEQLENGFVEASFRSMNSTVTVTLEMDAHEFERVIADVVHPFFSEFEWECSRFKSGNPLDQLNQSPAQPVEVPQYLFEAIRAAHESYSLTHGSFDPRILSALKAVGYEKSFNPDVIAPGYADAMSVLPRTTWQPTFEPHDGGGTVALGGVAIDLGGIGKGLAVDLITEQLTQLTHSGLVNAGGDIQAWGVNPDGDAWRVGVENPFADDDAEPVAVLELTNTGLATSSVRRRRWNLESGMPVHHLIDPKTGRPAGATLQSVTVCHEDTRTAETLTKAIFVAGSARAQEVADSFDIAALWITDSGQQFTTPKMTQSLLWVSQQ